jgi:hypothetical protein
MFDHAFLSLQDSLGSAKMIGKTACAPFLGIFIKEKCTANGKKDFSTNSPPKN